MAGFFDNMKGMFGKDDTNGVFRFNPQNQKQERSWLKYADGVYEPVRKGQDLRKKSEGHREFQWWQENKPAEWKPQDDGKAFSWNHAMGSKDDLADQTTGKPFKPIPEEKREPMPYKPTPEAKGEPMPFRPEDAKLDQAHPWFGQTLLGQGGAGAEKVEQFASQKDEETPPPRSSAQDATELKEREKREISSAEHARDLKQLEQEQEISGSAKAGTSGALGGMVQSKGQGKAGKASGNDPRIDRFGEDYQTANDSDKGGVKKTVQKRDKRPP